MIKHGIVLNIGSCEVVNKYIYFRLPADSQLTLSLSLKVEVKNKMLNAADVHVYRWSTIHPESLVTRNSVHGRCVTVTQIVYSFCQY